MVLCPWGPAFEAQAGIHCLPPAGGLSVTLGWHISFLLPWGAGSHPLLCKHLVFRETSEGGALQANQGQGSGQTWPLPGTRAGFLLPVCCHPNPQDPLVHYSSLRDLELLVHACIRALRSTQALPMQHRKQAQKGQDTCLGSHNCQAERQSGAKWTEGAGGRECGRQCRATEEKARGQGPCVLV